MCEYIKKIVVYVRSTWYIFSRSTLYLKWNVKLKVTDISSSGFGPFN